jgi:hypothetical protein
MAIIKISRLITMVVALNTPFYVISLTLFPFHAKTKLE